jgi:hypothetical protein
MRDEIERVSADEGSGYAAFLDPDVNRMLKKVLNHWGKFLMVCSPNMSFDS